MKYEYTIVGRTPGQVTYETYEGTFESDQKERSGIIQEAFKNEFSQSWVDEISGDDFEGQKNGNKINGVLDTGEFTFDFEITEVEEGPPFPKNYNEFKENHKPLLDWCQENCTTNDTEIDEELIEALENGMNYIFEGLDSSDVLEHYIQQSKDGCKGWSDMSREQLLEEIWNTHGDPYTNNNDHPTWEGFLKQF